MPWNPVPRAITCPWYLWLPFSGHRLVVLLNYRSGLEVDQRADCYQPERVSDFQLWSRVALVVPGSAIYLARAMVVTVVTILTSLLWWDI